MKIWEDVSEEVCREIAEGWGRKHGFGWPRKVVKGHEDVAEKAEAHLRHLELQ